MGVIPHMGFVLLRLSTPKDQRIRVEYGERTKLKQRRPRLLLSEEKDSNLQVKRGGKEEHHHTRGRNIRLGMTWFWHLGC